MIHVPGGVCDPTSAFALQELQVRHPGEIAIGKYASAKTEGMGVLAKEIEERHDHVDTVIANPVVCLDIALFGDRPHM